MLTTPPVTVHFERLPELHQLASYAIPSQDPKIFEMIYGERPALAIPCKDGIYFLVVEW